MSLNRENIIWKSGSGWYIGFFDCSVWGEDPAKIYDIFEGTAEIQRLVIARAISGRKIS